MKTSLYGIVKLKGFPTKPGKYYRSLGCYKVHDFVLVTKSIDGRLLATHCGANFPTKKPATCGCNWVLDMTGKWVSVSVFPWELNAKSANELLETCKKLTA
jgi:hypothetical protein